jgi:DNA-binding PadR family transcriptional regulator
LIDISTWDIDAMNKGDPSRTGKRSSDVPLPLTPAVFYILVSLADRDRHGYAIMQEVRARSAGSVRLGPGTLYGALSRMLKDGLIMESTDRPEPEIDDSRRRYYRLTDRGSRALAAEAKRLETLARLARSTRVVRELKQA